MKTIFTLLLIVIPFTFFAQNSAKKEYVITKNNDTIYGKIKRAVGYGFKIKTESGERYKLHPYEDRAFQTYNNMDKNSYFEVVTVNFYGRNRKIFLERILDGDIKVYYYPNIRGESYKDVYYLKKNTGSGKMAEVSHLDQSHINHKKISDLIADKPSLAIKYKDMRGKMPDILSIVEEYNNQ